MASGSGELGNVFDHHVQRAVCDSRAKYREGRRPRAVKVYTINLESQYLLIQGVPAVGAMKELVERFALYGAIEQYNALDEYPAEDFTEVYLIKYMNLQSARTAKRKMDEQSFFGGLLHVCYAPEFETIEETRKKLQERKSYIARTTKNKGEHVDRSNSSQDASNQHYNHSDSLQKIPMKTLKNSVACPHAQKAIIPSEAVDRFMPRTTQLQERKRRREDDQKLGTCLETTSSRGVLIGPLLPDIPKADMHDDSLNTTANLIRNKLKEVTSPVPKPPEDKLEDVHTSYPLKQRRRI
ncbi:RNA-binding protein 48 isoform X2 [Manis pentadactyla]|uniref:RNA-binding protein 48 isoform X2 n=1 Tax=Manis pentadactyla TaxID=143292 RepID=UPI00255C7D17|nr:RNA-binding protein 48 isoform X2 [Manis pentadactyla]